MKTNYKIGEIGENSAIIEKNEYNDGLVLFDVITDGCTSSWPCLGAALEELKSAGYKYILLKL